MAQQMDIVVFGHRKIPISRVEANEFPALERILELSDAIDERGVEFFVYFDEPTVLAFLELVFPHRETNEKSLSHLSNPQRAVQMLELACLLGHTRMATQLGTTVANHMRTEGHVKRMFI